MISSDLIAAYREGYSTRYVLTRLIENRRKTFDSSLFIEVVLMNL